MYSLGGNLLCWKYIFAKEHFFLIWVCLFVHIGQKHLPSASENPHWSKSSPGCMAVLSYWSKTFPKFGCAFLLVNGHFVG